MVFMYVYDYLSNKTQKIIDGEMDKGSCGADIR